MDINLNATLLGEMLTFAVLVWATMKYIWPPLTKIMQERQEKIAAGLEAAQQGQRSLELAKKDIAMQIVEAKNKAELILDNANQNANNIIEESRIKAQEEYNKILIKAKLSIDQEINKAKQELRQEAVDLIITTTEKILQKEIDANIQAKLISKLIQEI